TRESAAARCGVARRKTGRGAPAGAAPATTWRSTRDRLGATEGSPAKPSQTDPSASANCAGRRTRPGESDELLPHATTRGAWRETHRDFPVPDHDPGRPTQALPERIGLRGSDARAPTDRVQPTPLGAPP